VKKFKNTEAEAAYRLADLFAQTVLRKLEVGYRDLYVWEQGALDWLKEWRKRDQDTPINAWTSCYMNHGPPPWRPDQQ
jgi:hypothetical protein